MATKVKPCRIKATGTPQVGYVPKYVDEDTFQWGAGGGGGGSDIVYATQAEYEALLPGALTDNKHYFIYEEEVGPTPPTPWQPGADCVAYYPFDTDTLDAEGTTTFTVTSSGIELATTDGVNALYNNGSGASNIDLAFTRANITSIFCWVKGDGANGDSTLLGERRASGGYDQHRTIDANGKTPGEWGVTRYDNGGYYLESHTQIGTSWTCLGYIETTTGAEFYINGVLVASSNQPSDWAGLTYNMGVLSWINNGSTGRSFKGYISKLALYNAEKSEADYLAFYNGTKEDYGIS